MTKKEAIDIALRWLNEATINGISAREEYTADLKDRMAYLLNGTVKFIAEQFPLKACYTFINNPFKNLLGDDYVIKQIIPPDNIDYTTDGQSVYFEVSGNSNITIKNDETTVLTGTSQDSTYTQFRYTLPANTDGKMHIIIQSLYPFNVRNMAVYPCIFKDNQSVPEYSQWVKYDMPDNYRNFDNIVKNENNVYRDFSNYRKEGAKTILIPRYETGMYEVYYEKNPAVIPYNADDDTILDVKDKAAELIPLKLAVDCATAIEDLASVSYFLDNKFSSMLLSLKSPEKGEILKIQTVYGM